MKKNPPPLYHVSAAANRDSIRTHGLDVSRMGMELGIAGATEPEVDGVFLNESLDGAWYFATFADHPSPRLVDIWEVSGVSVDELVKAPEGYSYYPGRIPAENLRLHERDLDPADAAAKVWPERDDESGHVSGSFAVVFRRRGDEPLPRAETAFLDEPIQMIKDELAKAPDGETKQALEDQLRKLEALRNDTTASIQSETEAERDRDGGS